MRRAARVSIAAAERTWAKVKPWKALRVTRGILYATALYGASSTDERDYFAARASRRSLHGAWHRGLVERSPFHVGGFRVTTSGADLLVAAIKFGGGK